MKPHQPVSTLLFNAIEAARSGGICIQTFNKRVQALGIRPAAVMAGRKRIPLFSQADVCEAVRPYVVARSLRAFPSVSAQTTATAIREQMKADSVEAAEERASAEARGMQKAAELNASFAPGLLAVAASIASSQSEQS